MVQAGIELGPVWQGLATLFGSLAVWMEKRAQPERDPLEELTYRLRNPVRHALQHPVVTLRRKQDRRRAS